MITNELYLEDLKQACLCISMPKDSSVLITGATGLLGSFMMDMFIYHNKYNDANIHVTGTSRSQEKLQDRFGYGMGSGLLKLVARDSISELPADEKYDFIIHLASNADPRSYALYPAETITTNVCGIINVLNYAKANTDTKVFLASTFEVYGQMAKETFKENDYGLVDFNAIRSGYPESKRVAELLVRSYAEQYGISAVVGRLCSIYGPTMTATDNKVVAQFVKKVLAGEDVVLKSKGEQMRSWCYVSDAAMGIMTVLQNGTSKEAYNIANPKSEATIAEVADIAAKLAGKSVVFDLPDELEQKGFSKPQNSVLDASQLMELGFMPQYNTKEGIKRTLDILQT